MILVYLTYHLTYDDNNLHKHDVSRQEVDEVLSQEPVDIEIEPSKKGHTRVMFVGFIYSGRLLEVGVEYVSDRQDHVFHAMNATRQMRKLFGKRK